MKERLIGILNRTRNSAHVIRLIVGAYVAYTCGSVTVAYFTTDEVSLLMMLGSAAVALCGVAITLLSLWAIAKGYSIEYGGKAPWTMAEDEEEAEEEDGTEQLPEECEDEAEESTEVSDGNEDIEE